MENEYEKLGLGISDDEWMEKEYSGINVHPEVSKIQAFQDPTNGVFDRTKVYLLIYNKLSKMKLESL